MVLTNLLIVSLIVFQTFFNIQAFFPHQVLALADHPALLDKSETAALFRYMHLQHQQDNYFRF